MALLLADNCNAMSAMTTDRYCKDRFPEALGGLMEEHRLSYRQLAYMTKLSAGHLSHLRGGSRRVPADPVIAIIAKALSVKPDYFLEYRLRQVLRRLARMLDDSPQLADELYEVLVRKRPVPEDFGAELGKLLAIATPRRVTRGRGVA